MPRNPLPSPFEAAAAVIVNLQAAASVLLFEAHAASARLGMAHHVGHGLAHRERKHALLHRRQLHGGGRVTLHGEAGGLQRRLGLRQFGHQALSMRYPRIASRTSVKACREICSTSRISFPARCGSRSINLPASSDFSVMTESVCPKTSCRSRAMRSRSATFARFSISSFALRSWQFMRLRSAKKMFPAPMNMGKPAAQNKLPSAHVQQKSFDGRNRPDQPKSRYGASLGAHHERNHGGGEDKERASTRIERKVQDSQQQHAADVDQRPRPFQQENSPVEDEKDRGSKNVKEPLGAADMFCDRLNKEEAEIKPPQQRTPSVISVVDHGPKRPQFQRPTPATQNSSSNSREPRNGMFIFSTFRSIPASSKSWAWPRTTPAALRE